MSKQINIEEYFELMKTVAGIQVKPEWEDTVKAHIQTAEKMANIVEVTTIDENSLEFSNTYKPSDNYV